MPVEEHNNNNENIARLINLLPDDVARHIYEEYFVAKETCNLFLDLLQTDASQNLDYKPLLGPVQRLLDHPCSVEFLCNHNVAFKQMYTQHYVHKKKYFVQMNMLESFVLSILMWLYH
jgi:hypothetical protein